MNTRWKPVLRLPGSTLNAQPKALSLNSRTTDSNKQVLAEIYVRYSLDIFRYAYRVLDNRELAEDCVAETFYRFLMAVQAGTSFENVRAYLFRIAHNWITDRCRRQLPVSVSLKENLPADPEGNPSELLSQNQDLRRIQSALLRLPAEQRQVIELRYLEGWSHMKVAEALGKTVEATRALQYRAMEALRQILAE
jgi:RNA polymerase sigma-70 factor (ECF subfamily)